MTRVAPELGIMLFGLPMFLGWEILQSPFYTDTFTNPWRQVLYNRLHCTVGDVMILLAAFWLVAMVWGRSWIERRAVAPKVLFVVGGLFYTIFSEYRNVYLAQHWAYSEWMPTLGGIGLVPVFQWLVIPALIICVRRP